jgi:hypothetical protein
MLISKSVKIKFNAYSCEYYRNLGYVMTKGEFTEIKVEDVQHGSNVIVEAKCDVCMRNKKIPYKQYRGNIHKHNIYACSHKCKMIKTSLTKIEKYGTPGYSNQEKALKTKEERYGTSSYNNKEKRKKTNIERYGVENVFQSEEKKEKIKETSIERYGVDHPSKSKQVQDKIFKTKEERYGLGTYNNQNKMKNTKEERYGSSTYNNQNKMKNTMLERYGVEHILQHPDFFNKQIKSGLLYKKYKNTNLKYQGLYELDFLENYYDLFTIEKPKSFPYIIEGNKKYYYPDFYIKELDLYVEIKSSWWYFKHEKMNIMKIEAVKKSGCDIILVMDKNYENLNKLIKTYVKNNN